MAKGAGVGRMVRWDEDAGSGAAVVEGLPAEVQVHAGVVESPGDRPLQPGELVELEYTTTGGRITASRVCPADGES